MDGMGKGRIVEARDWRDSGPLERVHCFVSAASPIDHSADEIAPAVVDVVGVKRYEAAVATFVSVVALALVVVKSFALELSVAVPSVGVDVNRLVRKCS